MYTATLDPCAHLDQTDSDTFTTLALDHALPRSYELRLLRRRGTWMSTLPAAVFNPEVDSLSYAEEEVLRFEVEREARAAASAYGYVRTRDIVGKNDRWFYRDTFISAVMHHLKIPPIGIALVRLLRAAESPRSTLIRDSRKAKVRDPEARVQPDGRRTRGFQWSPAEDQTLRNWFGVHQYGPHKGKRVPLTEDKWAIVLNELKGNRTKSEIKRHLRELNYDLKLSLMVDGFLSRDAVDRYRREALGEGPMRMPRFRPRLYGRNYRDGGEFPLLGQPA